MIRVLSVAAAGLVLSIGAGQVQAQDVASACRPDTKLSRLAELPEASGLAISRRSDGHLWTHNDSGPPMVFALDRKGAIVGKVRISGVKVDDWEAIAVGPCPGGSCLYIGDIGDNDARRKVVTVYRVPEPAPSATTAAADAVYHFTYPDRAHDAEALLVTSTGTIYIVTKGDTGPVALYRAPAELRAGGTTRLERVGSARAAGGNKENSRITDGTVSTDGQWVALRSRGDVAFYRADEFFKGAWREARRVNLAPAGEPQGEGIALDSKQTVYLAGEGGGKKQPGTFVHFECVRRQ